MDADKRSVATDALATLGTIIDETAGRDAIHLAVEPMEAAARLYPGQDVGLRDGKACASATPLGIVDPFLRAPVQPGERFWLVVYPRQITSLRHVWSHPSFPEAVAPARKGSKSESETWLRNFCDTQGNAPSYESIIAGLLNPSNDYGTVRHEGDYLLSYGSELAELGSL